ncbi:MAG: HAD hydrolase-like protein [Clostridia bacterium]|nr:HAD hydrolase-like protein [Clostridia bacterium]
MKYTHLFFDLDGTLVDSGEGIIKGIEYSLKKFGITVEDNSVLRAFIGPPLVDSFKQHYGFETEKAMLAIKYYREYYNEIGIRQAYVYNGLVETLQALKDKGYVLAVATSKPEVLANRVLEYFGLAKFFDTISGASLDERLSHKDVILDYALKKYGVDRAKCLMIGDRKFDVLGAKANSIDCLGVLYGYGDLAEMEKAGATYIVKTPTEILELLENL